MFLIGLALIVVSFIIFIISYRFFKSEKSNTRVTILCFIVCVFSLLSVFTTVNNCITYYNCLNKPKYVIDLQKSSTTNNNQVLSDVVNDIDKKYPDCDIYDKVEFSINDKLTQFDKLKYCLYLSSNVLDYDIKPNTNEFIIKGSDIVQASDVVKHIGIRGGIYYTDIWYIRYKDKFYAIGNEKLNIDKDKFYTVKYAKDGTDTISDLSGEYKAYNSCSVYVFK